MGKKLQYFTHYFINFKAVKVENIFSLSYTHCYVDTHTHNWTVWEVLNSMFMFSNWAVLRLVSAFMAALSSGPLVLTKHWLRDFIAVLFCSEVMCFQQEPSCPNIQGLDTKVVQAEMRTLTWTINSSMNLKRRLSGAHGGELLQAMCCMVILYLPWSSS